MCLLKSWLVKGYVDSKKGEYFGFALYNLRHYSTPVKKKYKRCNNVSQLLRTFAGTIIKFLVKPLSNL